jgi:hypothetical protein
VLRPASRFAAGFQAVHAGLRYLPEIRYKYSWSNLGGYITLSEGIGSRARSFGVVLGQRGRFYERFWCFRGKFY